MARPPLENHYNAKYSRSGKTSQRGPQKMALPGLKSVHFVRLKVISLGHHVFHSVTLPGQKYNPIRPGLCQLTALKKESRSIKNGNIHKKLRVPHLRAFLVVLGPVSSEFSAEALHSAHLSPPFAAPMALLR
jgi:hypothetical protein